MTTGMTKDQTSDFSPRARVPSSQGPTMRRSRSLSELPGSVRVPIIKRTDNERMKQRLEAGVQGLEELKLLREQQQKQMEEVRNSALQKKPSSSQQNGRYSQNQPQLSQRRMSASLRLSSASLARINEEGDDSGSGSGSGNGKLQDCTNFGRGNMGHRRHSSYSLESTRCRRPINGVDGDVFENQLNYENESLRKTNSWSSLPAGYECRSSSTDNLTDRFDDAQSSHHDFRNNRKNQRSLSFSAISGNGSFRQNVRTSSISEEDISANNENIEPKLRRASIQCDAVLTKGITKRNQGIFKDVDLSRMTENSPSPLHAVLHGFKASNSQTSTSTTNAKLGTNGSNRSFDFGSSAGRAPTTSVLRRNSFHSEIHLAPRNIEQRYVSEWRSDTERRSSYTPPRISKVNSVPTNINNIHKTERELGTYFPKRYTNADADEVFVQLQRHFNQDSKEGKRSSDTPTYSKDVPSPRSSVSSRVRKSFSGHDSRADRSVQYTTNSTKPSNTNVVAKQVITMQDKSSEKRSQSLKLEDPVCGYGGQIKSFQKEKQTVEGQCCPTGPAFSEDVDRDGQKQLDTSEKNNLRSPNVSERKSVQDTIIPAPAPELSPVIQIPIHEKKFSIASDEGYVASPPSTPRGRHAHSIVSDSSWISTDFDETSSSCEPSPVHVSRDSPGKGTQLQLKRSDLSQEHCRAKQSRRCSDYNKNVVVDSCDRTETNKSPTAKQELFQYNSDEGLPFKQTAV